MIPGCHRGIAALKKNIYNLSCDALEKNRSKYPSLRSLLFLFLFLRPSFIEIRKIMARVESSPSRRASISAKRAKGPKARGPSRTRCGPRAPSRRFSRCPDECRRCRLGSHNWFFKRSQRRCLYTAPIRLVPSAARPPRLFLLSPCLLSFLFYCSL